MTIFQALLFGALQGITEFLPVSSSGNLAVLKSIMELQEVPVLFDVILHIATLIVVVLVFRDRIGRIIRSVVRWIARRSDGSDAEDLRLAWVIILASVITAGLGLAVNELDAGANTKLVSVLFIVTGALLVVARFMHGADGYDRIGVKHGLIVGFGQGLGVLPGISRSGITITAALVAGMDRERAGEFAFIVAIPAILGAFVLTLRDAAELSSMVSVPALIVGFVAALIVGLGALLILIRLIRRARLYLFSFYLIPLGIVGLILL